MVSNTTFIRGVISVTLHYAPELRFYASLLSWQSEAIAEVARRAHGSLRLDLLEKIAPSDLWLRTCCILRHDRSSQGFPRSKTARRTLAAAADCLALVRFYEGEHYVCCLASWPNGLHRCRLRYLTLWPPRDLPPRGPPTCVSTLRVRGIPPGLRTFVTPFSECAARPGHGAFSHPHRRRRPVCHQPG